MNTKNDLINSYQGRKEGFLKQVDILSRKIRLVSNMRLLIFLSGIASVIYFGFQNANFVVYSISAFLILFVIFIKFHDKLIRKKNYLQILIRINKEEISYHEGRWAGFEDGHEFLRNCSLFASDLDVFGKESLFQKINRTTTLSGKNKLAHWFRHPHQKIEGIKAYQQAIEELRPDIDFRQNFRAIGLMGVEHRGDYIRMIRWMRDEVWIADRLFFKIAILVIPIINILATLAAIFNLIPWSFVGFFIIATLIFLAPFQKRINKSYLLLGRRAAILLKYVELLKLVENKEFKSSMLMELQTGMSTEGQKAWKHIHELANILQLLDQRLNMLVGVFLNVYFLWDFRMLRKVELWKRKNMNNLSLWFNNIGSIDAFCSLATLAYNQPQWIYPEPQNEIKLKVIGLRHPLMKSKECVPNDIQIENQPYFHVITGANMAGKSTWLRTVGSNLLLAMMGSVVNAEFFQFSPANIATSLHTTDSLMKNESYFYSELKRLQKIIELLKLENSVFVLLDEILKGTNSGDKEAGSIALLKQLLDMKAYGIIATHDLNLAKIANHYCTQTHNYRFEAEIIDDKLYFDYVLKEGIAQNFNATFLMKKMGITM